jgi:hypothetical protein
LRHALDTENNGECVEILSGIGGQAVIANNEAERESW